MQSEPVAGAKMNPMPLALRRHLIRTRIAVMLVLVIGVAAAIMLLPASFRVIAVIALLAAWMIANAVVVGRFWRRLAAADYCLCPKCGYSLAGLENGPCPECGAAYSAESARQIWMGWKAWDSANERHVKMPDKPDNSAPSHEPVEKPTEQRITVQVNYLRWLEADGISDPPTADNTLEWLCRTIPHRPLMASLVGRYKKLGAPDQMLFAFPVEQVLVEKVLIPLHQAKAAFIMGHELGCIALCGMVGEMLAIFRFQVSPHGSGPTAMTQGRQKRLFGRLFEDIEHSRRIGILEMLGLIDEQTANDFTKLSRMRNAFLHRLSQEHDELAKQAIDAYGIVTGLAVKILGLGIQTRAVKISPEVLAYIRSKPQPHRDPPQSDSPPANNPPTD